MCLYPSPGVKTVFPYPWTSGNQAFLTWNSKAYGRLPASQSYILGTGVYRLGLSFTSNHSPGNSTISANRHHRQPALRWLSLYLNEPIPLTDLSL